MVTRRLSAHAPTSARRRTDLPQIVGRGHAEFSGLDRLGRIDVWTDNIGLYNYYLRNGFKHPRTLDLTEYPSGALFQRSTESPA